MNPNIVEELQYTNPLPDSVRKKIRQMGVITGSRTFGGFLRDTSDVDIILPPAFSEQVQSFYDLIGERYALYIPMEYDFEEFSSVYTNMPPSKYPHNLLLMKSDKAFEKWDLATDLMKKIMKSNPMLSRICGSNKSARVELFESLKAIVEAGTSRAVERRDAGTLSNPSWTAPPFDDDLIPF